MHLEAGQVDECKVQSRSPANTSRVPLGSTASRLPITAAGRAVKGPAGEFYGTRYFSRLRATLIGA